MPTNKGLKTGDVTELHCFFHIRKGKAQELRVVAENFAASKDKGDAFGIRTGVHDANLVLFDNDTRLLFSASFDTDWDPYIEEAVVILTPATWYSFLQFCEEVPDGRNDNPPDAEEVKALLEATRVTSSRYFRAYPEGTISEILKAQRLQKAFDQVLDNPDAAEALSHPALKPLLDEAAD